MGLRLITAAIGAPIVLVAIVVGGPWLSALVLIVAGLAGWELGQMARRAGIAAAPVLTVLGALAVGALLAPGIALRNAPDGLTWVLVVIIGTWACDTVAFLVGSRWGRTALAPRVSPQKTVEGTIAGVVAAVGVAAGAALVQAQPLPRLAGLGLVVGAGAVLGDLVESAIKRRLGAKESGWIMPGHGGILDRVDSLLFSGFLGYLYLLASGQVA